MIAAFSNIFFLIIFLFKSMLVLFWKHIFKERSSEFYIKPPLQISIAVLLYHHSTLYIVGKVVYTYFMYKSRSAQDVIFVYNNTITMNYINGSIGTSPSFFEGFGLIYTSNWKFLISFLSFVLHSLKVSWYIYCFISSVYFYVIHWIDKHCLSYHSSQANSLHHDN